MCIVTVLLSQRIGQQVVGVVKELLRLLYTANKSPVYSGRTKGYLNFVSDMKRFLYCSRGLTLNSTGGDVAQRKAIIAAVVKYLQSQRW